MSATAAYFIAIAVAGFIIVRLIRSAYLDWRMKRSWEQQGKQQVFDNQLSQYNLYYKSLDSGGRRRFLQRVGAFMESKDFQYIEIEAEEIMPLLISAAAIQLTFGLTSFLLDYFRTIYIL